MIRTHKLTIVVRFEGEPLDTGEKLFLATSMSRLISGFLGHKSIGDEFCDLGLHQDTDITVGEPI